MSTHPTPKVNVPSNVNTSHPQSQRSLQRQHIPPPKSMFPPMSTHPTPKVNVPSNVNTSHPLRQCSLQCQHRSQKSHSLGGAPNTVSAQRSCLHAHETTPSAEHQLVKAHSETARFCMRMELEYVSAVQRACSFR
eukprot:1524871-Rhodomonas_salina.1